MIDLNTEDSAKTNDVVIAGGVEWVHRRVVDARPDAQHAREGHEVGCGYYSILEIFREIYKTKLNDIIITA